MNTNDAIRFGEIFATLCEVFDKQTSPAVMKVYFDVLSQYSICDVEAAATMVLQKCKFFPKPSEIIDLISCNLAKSSQSINDRATMQATEVMRQVRFVGSYGTPVFDDPITDWLMHSRWSWRSVCSMTETEHKFWSKDFQEAYRAAYQGGQQRAIGDNTGCGVGVHQTLRLIAGGIGKAA